MAPEKAPIIILTYPPIVVPKRVPSKFPNISITIATPKLAPVETPSIEGSARGLLKVVCSNSPDTASAAPASAAVIIMGILDCSIIIVHDSFSTGLPVIISHIASTGIFTAPVIRFVTPNRDSNIIRAQNTIVNRCLFRNIFVILSTV